MPTTTRPHELDAAAAMEGAGVALLSPILFAAQLRDGKLIQPFPHVLRGPAQHFLLLKREKRGLPYCASATGWSPRLGCTTNPAPKSELFGLYQGLEKCFVVRRPGSGIFPVRNGGMEFHVLVDFLFGRCAKSRWAAFHSG
jgi:hypothetical protein